MELHWIQLLIGLITTTLIALSEGGGRTVLLSILSVAAIGISLLFDRCLWSLVIFVATLILCIVLNLSKGLVVEEPDYENEPLPDDFINKA